MGKIKRRESIARAFAERYASAYPGNSPVYGIAFECVIEGMKAVTGPNSSIPDDLRAEIVKMLMTKYYTPRYISEQMGIDISIIMKIKKEINITGRHRKTNRELHQ